MHPAAQIPLDREARSSSRDPDERWDEFNAAMGVLRERVRGNGASDLVLADLLEDDLRQARLALHAVQEFLDGAIETVGREDASPAALVDAADTALALDALERLEGLLPAARRRLGQVALRLVRR